MRREWKDPECDHAYHVEDGELYTHAFAGEPIRTDPDGFDGEALLREFANIVEENRALKQEVNANAADELKRRRETSARIAALEEENRRLRTLLPVFKASRPEDEPHAAAMTKLYEHWILHSDTAIPEELAILLL